MSTWEFTKFNSVEILELNLPSFPLYVKEISLLNLLEFIVPSIFNFNSVLFIILLFFTSPISIVLLSIAVVLFFVKVIVYPSYVSPFFSDKVIFIKDLLEVWSK